MNSKNTFLFLIALFLSFGLIAQREEGNNKINNSLKPFYHGVASGDPTDSSVILWTRVTPDTINANPISVSWRIALDTGMTAIVASGNIFTDLMKDLTVKVDVSGLQPASKYFYRFKSANNVSPVGETRTLPEADVSKVTFGIFSCSNYPAGFFTPYMLSLIHI